MLRLQVGVASGWFDGAVHLAANMSLLAVLGYGGSLVVASSLTAGELTSFLVYSLYVGINISQVCKHLNCESFAVGNGGLSLKCLMLRTRASIVALPSVVVLQVFGSPAVLQSHHMHIHFLA